MRPEPIHILILLIIVLLIFGAPKLPGMARNIGKSLKIFKSEVKDLRGDSKPDEDDEDTTPQRPLEGKIVENENKSGTTANSRSTTPEA